MVAIAIWVLIYDVVVAASIIFLGNPNTLLGQLTIKSLLSLLLDWRFMLGAILAVGARFIFVVINNLASKHPALADAHLTITAIASITSVVMIVLANHFLLGDALRPIQILGIGIVLVGITLVFR
jgi:drug/metabolite transporter (DMT)-like permease